GGGRQEGRGQEGRGRGRDQQEGDAGPARPPHHRDDPHDPRLRGRGRGGRLGPHRPLVPPAPAHGRGLLGGGGGRSAGRPQGRDRRRDGGARNEPPRDGREPAAHRGPH